MKIRNLAITLMLFVWASASNAALFYLTYDSNGNNIVEDADIVGTGTFSYDGPISAGAFLLSDLANVSFSATFGTSNFSGPAFDPTDLSLIGIDITDVGGGIFEMVFTGNSASTTGSLDIDNNLGTLSHQPASLTGGATPPNLYFMNDDTNNYFGDYIGIAQTQVSEPASIILASLGLLGVLFTRKKSK